MDSDIKQGLITLLKGGGYFTPTYLECTLFDVGMKKSELAKRARCSPSVISNILAGKKASLSTHRLFALILLMEIEGIWPT